MSTSKSVSVKNLVKTFEGAGGRKVTAVNNVSLTIEPGEFVTLLGPSGCGKTTILRMVAGFENPTSGDVLIGGERVNTLTPDRRDTAMVFQSYALFPHLNVFENVAYGLKIKKMKPDDIRAKVTNILALVGLADMEGRSPNQLSGGQQQRVALARALVMEPAVLLFDEPLSNLDAKLRIHMRREIRKIQRQFGITSIYVTHDQAEAMSMSDRIIVMNKGVIEQVGTPKEIYATPASQFVADFIGTANIIPSSVLSCGNGEAEIEALGTRFRVKTGLALQKGDAVKLIVRPEAVALSRDSGIPAEIASSVFMGSYQDYVLSAHDQTLLIIDSDPANHETFDAGEKVFLGIAPNKLHIVK
ncbi:MAG: ABC transporter ATP-binding protein [Veillonellaceae bacterium]|nr:ABC transporter ATP-binding protein [Veillonellaceae bacterium]